MLRSMKQKAGRAEDRVASTTSFRVRFHTTHYHNQSIALNTLRGSANTDFLHIWSCQSYSLGHDARLGIKAPVAQRERKLFAQVMQVLSIFGF